MGLFDGFKKKGSVQSADESEARRLLDLHLNKQMNDATFLKEFAKLEILYTTPAGDTKDGKQKFFLIPGPQPTAYMPLFLNEAEIKEFYDKAGRGPFLILKGTLKDLVEVGIKQNKEDKMNFKYGYMIDPFKYKVTLDAPMLEPILSMINS